MKVLHLLASNTFSGAENVVCTIIKCLENEIDMIYCSPLGPIKTTLEKNQIKYEGIEKLSYKEINKIVKKYKPDIIHAHDYKASILAALFSEKSKIISHIHKNDPNMKKITLKSFTYLFILNRFYKIIGVSESICNEMIIKSKVSKKYITLYNYVDKNKVNTLANEFEIDRKYDLCFCGRFSPEKNPLLFIDIVEEMKKTQKKITAIMIGNGVLFNECTNIIASKKLENNIKMVGFKENPFPYIKASNIMIVPSTFEGFGLSVIEGLILKKVVLTSGNGGLKDIFINHQEYICETLSDYLKKIKYYSTNKKNNLDDIINKYTNMENWKEDILNIYK